MKAKFSISSRKNDIRKWLFNKHSALYCLILVVLSIFIFYAIANGLSSPSADKEESSVVDTDETESNTTYLADNNSYCIRVNKAKNFITIYKVTASGELLDPVKTFVCSVNSNVEEGTTEISEKYIWRKIADDVYGEYTSRAGVNVYIHSAPFRTESTNSIIQAAYNNLGKTASIGSIYLQIDDAKWIYENCGKSTKVIVYSDPDEEPAIALAEVTPLSEVEGVDTSGIGYAEKVSPAQVWFLRGVQDFDISIGETIDLWDGIFAADTNNNDITSYVYLTGSYDNTTPGRYIVTYNLVDEYGTKIAYQSIINVHDGTEETEAETSAEQAAPETIADTPANNNGGTSDPGNSGSSNQNQQNGQDQQNNAQQTQAATSSAGSGQQEQQSNGAGH